MLGISEPSAKRWRIYARAWLYNEIKKNDARFEQSRASVRFRWLLDFNQIKLQSRQDQRGELAFLFSAAV